MYPRLPLGLRLRPRQLWLLDGLAAAAYWLAAWLVFTHKVLPLLLGVTATSLAALGVLLCRRQPIVALSAALVSMWLGMFAPVLAFIAVPPLAYTVYWIAGHYRLRTAVIALIAGLSGPLATALPDFTHVGAVIPFSVALVLAWTAGYARGQQRQYGEQLVRHQAEQERMRIARELHDIVAHGMSVITVQAAFGHLVIDDRPAEAKAALAAIESTGRETLAEMRQLLGVLRQEGAGPALGPAPSLADVGGLIARTGHAGVKVRLTVSGSPRALPAGIELSGYRILQEALTNVVKHAGTPAACAAISYREGELGIEVTDNGRGGPVSAGGHGLAGMRERVRLYGGDLDAGPLPGRGFRVAVRIPVPMVAEPIA
jgi:signal transduction histidine kinase